MKQEPWDRTQKVLVAPGPTVSRGKISRRETFLRPLGAAYYMRHGSLLWDHADDLLSYARNRAKHLRKRGVVVFNEVGHKAIDLAAPKPRFVADDTPELDQRGGWPRVVKAVVATYDPVTEFVVIVIRSREICAYLVQPNATEQGAAVQHITATGRSDTAARVR